MTSYPVSRPRSRHACDTVRGLRGIPPIELAEVSAPDERTAVVRVMAGSINPSDVKNVAGASKQTMLPRIPGRDFAGVVENAGGLASFCSAHAPETHAWVRELPTWRAAAGRRSEWRYSAEIVCGV